MIRPSEICNRGRLTVHFNGVVGDTLIYTVLLWMRLILAYRVGDEGVRVGIKSVLGLPVLLAFLVIVFVFESRKAFKAYKEKDGLNWDGLYCLPWWLYWR